jgi:peptide/nickel transport system ATP-binding protein
VTEPLLSVEGLELVYQAGDDDLKALDRVSFTVAPGEIVGIVGESGCGKSTLGSALIGLLPPNAEVIGGRVMFKGRDLLTLDDDELRGLRGSEIGMVFQDPFTSLHPTFRIGSQLVDAQRAHAKRGERGRGELRRRAIDVLEQVGIPDAPTRIKRFPHEFSGGMRQRIMISLSLLLHPSLLIADEPTSALDVTLQAQIVELLRRLRGEYGTAVVFVSHDLGLVSRLCDRVVVMYAGRAVEQGPVDRVFGEPRHPYTRALIGALPSHRKRHERLTAIRGRVPALGDLPAGCTFADRCDFARDVCRAVVPADLGLDGARRIRCHAHDPESGYAEEVA